MIDWKKEAEAQKTSLIALRRELHQHPELGLQEHRTARRIEEELDKLGITHERVGETGVLATLRGEKAGGVTALRADIDALPIQETNNLPYASQTPGVMHACGHDAHTACLLTAAKLLAAHRAELRGEVRLLFQQAEEIGQGARQFVRAGALQGTERVFGLHTAYDLPAGSVGLKPGLNNASVDHFTVTILCRGAHVSTPELGVDALYIAAQTVVAAQALVTRCSSPVEPVILGIGKLNAGTTYNSVAEQAVFEGTTRTVSQESRRRMQELLDAAAQNTAAIYGGTAEIVWEDFASPLLNTPEVCTEAAALVTALGGQVITDRKLSLSGDDFAEFLLEVPGAYAYLGTGNPAKPGTLVPNHNGNFDIDEDVLPLGAALYAAYAARNMT